MRRTLAESSPPQGPVIALDKMVEALRDAVAAALATTPRLAFDRIVAELECSFAQVELAVSIAAAPVDHASRRVVGEMRAFVWAMLPLELYLSPRAVLPSKGRHVMDDANATQCAVDGEDDPASSGGPGIAGLPRARARRFDRCLMLRSTRSTGRKHG